MDAAQVAVAVETLIPPEAGFIVPARNVFPTPCS
jgi:hypothetical protein